jgi:hypothetical protein
MDARNNFAFFIGRRGPCEPYHERPLILAYLKFLTRSGSLISRPALRCGSLPKELNLDVDRYWRMRFYSSAGVTDYQLRLPKQPASKYAISICQLGRRLFNA